MKCLQVGWLVLRNATIEQQKAAAAAASAAAKVAAKVAAAAQLPFEKRRCHAIPRPFQPPHPCTLVDCGVVEVGEWAVQSILPAQSQIATSILPPPRRKIRPKSPSKNDVATPSPGRFSPHPYARSFIVVFCAIDTRQCGLIHPPGRKL